MTDLQHIRLWGGGVCTLSIGFWVGDGRSGTRAQGAGYEPGSAPCFCGYVADKREGLRLRASLPPVLADPLGGVGSTFSRCRRWLYGGLRRERRGRCFQGRKGPRCLARRERGSFGQGSFEGSVPLKIVDHPSPGSQGRGYGTRWDEEMALLHRRTFRFRLSRGPARGPLGWA